LSPTRGGSFFSTNLQEEDTQMPRIVHFEIPADKPERAVKFYTDVFGWKMETWPGAGDYWLATTGKQEEPGINGAIMKRSKELGGCVVNTVGVTSVDEFTAKIQAAGGKLLQPKMAVMGVGWVAYFKDTEGYVFGVYQDDKSAR
jgi:uncharacterized protein